jgi:hypothetical protein
LFDAIVGRKKSRTAHSFAVLIGNQTQRLRMGLLGQQVDTKHHCLGTQYLSHCDCGVDVGTVQLPTPFFHAWMLSQ